MYLWNKVLVGVICVVSVAFLLLGMRALKIHQYWGNLSDAYEYFLEKDTDICQALAYGGNVPLTVEENAALRQLRDYYKSYNGTLNLGPNAKYDDFVKAVINATAATGRLDKRLLAACTFTNEAAIGMARAKSDLQVAVNRRGRAWDNISALTINEKTGQISATNGLPTPQGLANRLTVFLFDKSKPSVKEKAESEPDQEAAASEETKSKAEPQILNFLGEFIVESVVEQQKPAGQVLQEERKEVLVQLKPAYAMLPRELARLKQSADACKAESRTWVFHERLPWDENADYRTLLAANLNARIRMNDMVAGAEQDSKLAELAAKEAAVELECRHKDKAQIAANVAQGIKERDATIGHYKAVLQKFQEFSADVERLVASNRDLSQKVAKQQKLALGIIDDQSRDMVQLSTGR
jgi:hypothetical protein